MSDEKTIETPETEPLVKAPERTSILTDPPEGGGEAGGEAGEVEAPKAEAKPADAPVDYSGIKLPEGVELDQKGFDEVKAIASEYKVPPEGFQKLLDKHIEVTQAAAAEPYRLFKEMVEEWEDTVQKDPEIGGENFSKMRTTIARAFDQYVPKENRAKFDQALVMTGAGSNPEIIRGFYRMAKQLTEGGHISGRPLGARKPETLAAALGYTDGEVKS